MSDVCVGVILLACGCLLKDKAVMLDRYMEKVVDRGLMGVGVISGRSGGGGGACASDACVCVIPCGCWKTGRGETCRHVGLMSVGLLRLGEGVGICQLNMPAHDALHGNEFFFFLSLSLSLQIDNKKERRKRERDRWINLSELFEEEI